MKSNMSGWPRSREGDKKKDQTMLLSFIQVSSSFTIQIIVQKLNTNSSLKNKKKTKKTA